MSQSFSRYLWLNGLAADRFQCAAKVKTGPSKRSSALSPPCKPHPDPAATGGDVPSAGGQPLACAFTSLFFSLAGNSSMAADVFMTGRSGGAIMMIKD
jgi:hypothetical protein